MTDKSHLVGKWVVVQNPQIEDARWEGFCFAYGEDPHVSIEQEDGFRITLPAAWATQEDNQIPEAAANYFRRLRKMWGNDAKLMQIVDSLESVGWAGDRNEQAS